MIRRRHQHRCIWGRGGVLLKRGCEALPAGPTSGVLLPSDAHTCGPGTRRPWLGSSGGKGTVSRRGGSIPRGWPMRGRGDIEALRERTEIAGTERRTGRLKPSHTHQSH